MAKQIQGVKAIVSDINRPGIHSKTKVSSLKSSKLYKKQYKGQGR